MRLSNKILIAILIVITTTSSLSAGSLYGRYGIGERQYVNSARSLGMGGLNISIVDKYTMSRWNPAQWVNISPVRINLFSTTNYNSPEGGTSGYFTEFSGFSMGIPAGKKIVFGGGIYPVSKSKYEFIDNGQIKGEDYVVSIAGRGGLSAFGLGIGYRFSENLSIGFKFDWLFGVRSEEWNINFVDFSKFGRTIYKETSNIDGSLVTLGLLYNLSGSNLAASVSIPTKSTIQREKDFQSIETTTFPKNEFDMPVELRFGFSKIMKESYRFGIETQMSDWSDLTNNFDGYYGSAYDIFTGLERMPSQKSNSFLGNIAYRGGFTIRKLYVGTSEDESLMEKSVTIGMSLPLGDDDKTIDLGLAFQSRGSNLSSGLNESGVLFTIGFSAGEKWFQKRRTRN